MLSTHTTKTPIFGASKLNYKSSTRHPLARFVTAETVALLFKGLLSTTALQHLRQAYQLEQYWWRHF